MMRRWSIAVVAAVLGGWATAATAADDDALVLPPGFRATVVHEGVGLARHLVVRANGDIYVATRQAPWLTYDPTKRAGMIALRSSHGDGKADVVAPFGEVEGTDIAIHDGMLYASDEVGVYRYRFKGDELVPSGPRETVVGGFPQERLHADKTFAFDDAGHLYVNVGGPSNACQEKDRTPGSPGQSPCPLLEQHGGIWRFDAARLNQVPADGVRYATGLRHSNAIEWNSSARALFVVMHGRDQLDTLWPAIYTAEDNATRVAEEMHLVRQNGNYGWPYTFYDVKLGRRMVAPEYGGDGKTPATPGRYADPLVAFPAHWAPNDLIFYTGKAFPRRYRGGAFIAFHGSWNRAPLPQEGYKVVFVPMHAGKVAGPWEVFADNFAGPLKDNTPRNARFRPCGLAVGPDGALYVADSQKGRIWRISYEGR